MIKMLRITDDEKLIFLNEKEGVNASYAYGLFDGNELLGYLLFDINDDEALLLKIRCENNLLKDGLTRAVLNYVLLQGVSKANFSDDFEISFLKEYKIINDDTRKIDNIEEVFKKCCG